MMVNGQNEEWRSVPGFVVARHPCALFIATILPKAILLLARGLVPRASENEECDFGAS